MRAGRLDQYLTVSNERFRAVHLILKNSIFTSSAFTPPMVVQDRLLRLAALFLSLQALALTLSPAARLRSWDVPLRWSHWLGLVIWLLGVILIHRQMVRHTPDADPYLMPTAALLAGWGLMTIFRLDAGFGLRQSLWLLVCILVFVIGIRMPQNLVILKKYKYVFLTNGLLLTALTLIFGTNPSGGVQRLWLGCCGIYLQPSEPLKLLLVIYLAAYLADRIPFHRNLLKLLFPSMFLTGLALAILLTQRDLGTASIFIVLYAAMIFMASGKRRLLLATLTLLLVAALVGYYFVDIIQYRLAAWWNPWIDPSGRSFQLIQSILAVANGGIYGRGPGLGAPGLVPVAHSDFIFTSIAEENGMLGTFALLFLLALITTRSFLVSLRAGNNFHRLLAAGIATYFSAQSILIIGGNLRLLPLTGVTLPFVSYGGSSLLTSFTGLLLLIQISNEVDLEPTDLRSPRATLIMATVILTAFFACALSNGWWGIYRADDLLARTDNPRRTIADRFVKRGSLFDRQNRAINITTGQPGEYIRRYLVPSLSPITGYTHPVYGQAGLEASLDPYLRGLAGNPTLLIWWEHVLYGQPPAGLNFRLSLDLDIQKRADRLLADHQGALLMVNASTGEILAMASHPTYDANQLDAIGEQLSNSTNGPLVNRAAQGTFPLAPLNSLLVKSAFGATPPGQEKLVNLFDQLGFYSATQVNLQVAAPDKKGTVKQLNVSPLQVLSAAAAIANKGICPGLQLASAVEIPDQGWVVMQKQDKPTQCLPAEGVLTLVEELRHQAQPFWEFTSGQSAGEPPITWYLAGTLPNWSGTPLALVILLEESNPDLARKIGQDVLLQTIKP